MQVEIPATSEAAGNNTELSDTAPQQLQGTEGTISESLHFFSTYLQLQYPFPDKEMNEPAQRLDLVMVILITIIIVGAVVLLCLCLRYVRKSIGKAFNAYNKRQADLIAAAQQSVLQMMGEAEALVRSLIYSLQGPSD